MTRGKHPRRLVRLLIAGLLVLSLIPLLPTQPAAARNTATIGDDTITITVPVELYWTNELLAEGWRKAVDSYWNHDADRGGPFRWCNRDVQFEFDIELVPRGERPSDDRRHNIFVRHVRPRQYFVSRVFYGRSRDQYDPTRHRAGGVWRYDAWDDSVAHEFGHLLGLVGEEYTYEDLNGNGRRDSNERTRPLPGMEDSIMATRHGRVLQRHIDRVMDKHQIGCGLHVVYHHEMTREWDNGYLRAFFDFWIQLQETETGTLEGIGEALNHDWNAVRIHPSCTYHIDLSEQSRTPEFEVTGTREGNSVSLTLPDGLGDGVAVVHTNTCGAAGHGDSGTLAEAGAELLYLREIEAELVDGRYENDRTGVGTWETHAVSSPVTLRHYILIVEDFPHHRRGGD